MPNSSTERSAIAASSFCHSAFDHISMRSLSPTMTSSFSSPAKSLNCWFTVSLPDLSTSLFGVKVKTPCLFVGGFKKDDVCAQFVAELRRQKKAVFRVKTGIISSSEHRRHLRTFFYPQLATSLPLCT